MSDHHRVADWPELHWQIARGACVAVVLLGLLLVWLGVLGAVAGMCATVVAVGYVLGLTRHFAKPPAP